MNLVCRTVSRLKMDSSKYLRKTWYNPCWMLHQTRGFSPCDLGPLGYPQKIPSTDKFLSIIIQFFQGVFYALSWPDWYNQKHFNLLVVVFLSLIDWDLWKTVATSINYKITSLEFIIQGWQLNWKKFQILYEYRNPSWVVDMVERKNKGTINWREATRRSIFASLKDLIIRRFDAP